MHPYFDLMFFVTKNNSMKLYITFIITLMFSFSLSAQDNNSQQIVKEYVRSGKVSLSSKKSIRRSVLDEPFHKLGMSFGISSLGFNIEAATPINEKFKARAGFSFMPPIVQVNKQIEVKDQVLANRIVGGYYPDYKVGFKPSFFNFHMLVDYYPHETVPFHVTGGLYFGVNNIKASGELINPETGEKSVLRPGQEWPTLNVEGYALNIENGNLDATIQMGGLVKPYLGIGYGHVIAKNKLGFNFDLGVLYQGSYKIKQDGKAAVSYKDYESSAINIDKYTSKVKVWPMINFQLTYRVF